MLLLDGTGDLSSGREPHLIRSQRRSPLRGCLSAATCMPYSASNMDLKHGGSVICVRLCLQLCRSSEGNWRSGYGDTLSPGSFRAGAGSYSRLPWFWSLRCPFFCFRYVNIDVLQALDGGRPSLCRIYCPNLLQQLGTTPMSTSGLPWIWAG